MWLFLFRHRRLRLQVLLRDGGSRGGRRILLILRAYPRTARSPIMTVAVDDAAAPAAAVVVDAKSPNKWLCDFGPTRESRHGSRPTEYPIDCVTVVLPSTGHNARDVPTRQIWS